MRKNKSPRKWEKIVEEGGKQMYIFRGWREKVYLREDSPETICKP